MSITPRNATSRALAHARASTTRWPGRQSSCSGLGDRVAVFPVDLAGAGVRLLSGGPHLQPRPVGPARCSIATSRSCTCQWLRVYMRTQTIHHNKDLLQSVGDDPGCPRSSTSTSGRQRSEIQSEGSRRSPQTRRRLIKASWARWALSGRRRRSCRGCPEACPSLSGGCPGRAGADGNRAGRPPRRSRPGVARWLRRAHH